MQLMIRLMSGDIHKLDCEGIVSIDGREYTPEASDEREERLTLLEGRIEALESIISQALQPQGE